MSEQISIVEEARVQLARDNRNHAVMTAKEVLGQIATVEEVLADLHKQLDEINSSE